MFVDKFSNIIADAIVTRASKRLDIRARPETTADETNSDEYRNSRYHEECLISVHVLPR
jgi:hypothetical protein